MDDSQWLKEACEAAGLSGVQRELVELYLLEEMTVSEIRLKLHYRRVSEVQRDLGISLRKLSAIEGFWEPARAFPRHLLLCVKNRAVWDERPAGVRGVEPARVEQRLPAAVRISVDDPRLRQGLGDAAKLWAQNVRPVKEQEALSA